MTIAQPAPVPRRSGHGCLLGCLAAAAIVLLPILLVSAYSAWFFYQGFRHDPVLTAVSQLVRHDGIADQVLGENITVTGIDADSLSFVPGWGSHSAYSVALSGSKASGTLAVEADVDDGHVHLDSLILTGADGAQYDLMHHTVIRPPPSSSTTSI